MGKMSGDLVMRISDEDLVMRISDGDLVMRISDEGPLIS
jgi:hypothetical protein